MDEEQKQKGLLEKLSALVPGMIYQYQLYPDGRGIFPYISEGIRDIYELTSEEAKRDASLVFWRIHPEDLRRIKQSIKNSANDLLPWREEYRVVLPKKGVRWLRGDAVPERLNNDSVLWHGYISDITDFICSRQALTLSEDRLRIAFEGSNDGLWDWNILSNDVWYSPSYLHLLGFNNEKDFPPVIQSFYEQLHPDDKNRTLKAIQRHIDENIPFDVEFRLQHKNGEYYFFRARASCVRNNEDKAVRMAGTIRDVTERRQAEKALRESEARFHQMADNLKEVVWLSSADNQKFLYINSAYEKVWGGVRQDLYKNPELFYNNVHEMDRAKLKAEFEQYNDGGIFDIEFRIIDHQGETKWISAHSNPIYNSEGEVISHTGIAMDVTLQKETQEKLSDIANRDPLTGIYNRRYIFERLEQNISKIKRTQSDLCVVILDIDFFKKINDTYGHPAGDFVIKEFAKILSSHIRVYDLLGRYGGEEFILLLEDASIHVAQIVVSRILEKVNQLELVYEECVLRFTFSSGIASGKEIDLERLTPEALIELADQRLYRAKKEGRNRIVYT